MGIKVRSNVGEAVGGLGRKGRMSGRKRASVVQPLLLSIADVAIQIGVCRGGGVL